MSELAARELRAQGAKELLVANRTPDRAEQLASQVGGIPVALSELPVLLVCEREGILDLVPQARTFLAGKNAHVVMIKTGVDPETAVERYLGLDINATVNLKPSAEPQFKAR